MIMRGVLLTFTRGDVKVAYAEPTCSGCWLSEGGCGDLGCGGGILDTFHGALGADVVLLLVAPEPHRHVPGIGLSLELQLLEPLN